MTRVAAQAIPSFEIGAEIRSRPRRMTRDRMRWYVDTQATVAADDGRHHRGGPTIHDDDDYAKSQGLPGIIADGMVSTNWILDLLLNTFGPSFLKNGRLSTKYIAPVYEDQVVISCARVETVHLDAESRTTYQLSVWCEDDTGKMLTVGRADIASH
ncbi:MaoC dehydratase-like protein [Hyphomicrobiales bacterium]|nr:MaoC dehydratase-like protein [Hyphomicrobiales bacterium]CAH1691489.1 MaoC dehydratase-like protein [Hyphomicrobiales bacterium]